jgi:hypothetical protein
MATCKCAQALQHNFSTVRDSVHFKEMDEVLESCDLLARDEKKWMSIYRCRDCGALWTEACYSSGHVDIYYLYPAPPTSDPERWLREEATEITVGGY